MPEDRPALSAAVRLAGLAALCAVAALALASLAPPPAAVASAPETEFSAARAVDAARAVLHGPRPVGSVENAAARDRLVAALGAMGLEVDVQTATGCAHALAMRHCARLHNVVARLRGRGDDRRAVALLGHYDSVPGSPGASDDGAGVATLLEVARALRAGPPLAHDVLFVFDDAEENGLLGAVAFAREHPWRGDVRVALNFEARGAGGVSSMFDASPDSGVLVRAMADVAPYPVSSSLTSTLARALPNDTDGTVLKGYGVPVMNFAFIDGFERYHRATDTFEHLDPRSVQHHGSYALALARAFGDGDLGALHGPPRVWFDVLGRAVVVYPPAVGALLTALACAFFAAAVARRRRAGGGSLRGLLRGFGYGGLAVVVTVALSIGLARVVDAAAPWVVLVANGRAAALPHVALAVAVGLAALARARRTTSAADLSLGAAGIVLLGAVATAALAPGAGFLFHLPALFLAAAALAATFDLRPGVRFAVLCAGAVPAVYLLTNLAFTALLMFGGPAPVGAAACAALLVVLAWAPLAAVLDGAAAGRAAALAAAASVALALAAVVVARADRTTPRADSILYALDADAHQARWVSRDEEPDAFTRTFLGASPRREELPSIDAWPAPSLVAPAPFVDVSPPALEVVGDAVTGGRRALSLRLRSPRGARCALLFEPTGARIGAVRVDGRDFFEIVHLGSNATDRRFWALVAGAPPRDVWNLEICGLDAEGARVDLESEPGAHLALHVVDTSEGLPAGTVHAARGAGVIAGQSSDAIKVARRFDL